MGISKSSWLILNDEGAARMPRRLSMRMSQVEPGFEKGIWFCSAQVNPC